jgi:hypothetical protein
MDVPLLSKSVHRKDAKSAKESSKDKYRNDPREGPAMIAVG